MSKVYLAISNVAFLWLYEVFADCCAGSFSKTNCHIIQSRGEYDRLVLVESISLSPSLLVLGVVECLKVPL